MNVQREILIATGPKRVWSVLTDRVELQRWACEEAQVDENQYLLLGETVYQGTLGGALIDRVEGTRLQFEWPMAGEPTTVTITIQPEEDERMPGANFAQVTVRHEGVPEQALKCSVHPNSALDAMWALWLNHLAMWAERAEAGGRFNYAEPLSATVERHIVIAGDLATVWNYIVDPGLRRTWFEEPLGAEVERVERHRITYLWEQDLPGRVTFRLEPMPDSRTLVMVHHTALSEELAFDYHLGWQDYLVALSRSAASPVIRQTAWIQASPERVWKQFTSEAAMRKWWNAEMRFEPHVGGRVEFADHGSILVGYVTEMKPYARFAFTFAEEDTVGVRDPYIVTAELIPEADGMRVTLTQSGFENLPVDLRHRVFHGFQRGWAESPELERLVELVKAS